MAGDEEGSPKVVVTTTDLPVVKITAANIIGNGNACKGSGEIKGSILEKAEINEAVSKVLQGYNWSLVPSPTK
ncbi:hypothetical protein Phum_PHUM470910 [Pediculus humanus corporis]|uniref:Sox developmental protein N-terminal domain-containing protein n=1 Tax=Pediculus humanus subsp. corporis TaxID=121224 RepID=E0VVY0_PEDHC|nr:uncharacterized protein Phum_PHUM470910 [Pediculus humanus corporis]EEB17536.1 hypothetical protein Phum_PHUM470910 [Pediculus humanus corporis]